MDQSNPLEPDLQKDTPLPDNEPQDEAPLKQAEEPLLNDNDLNLDPKQPE